MADSATPPPHWPQVVERQSGHVVHEEPWQEGALAWFYPPRGEASWVARWIRWLLAHTTLPHHLSGWWFSRPASAKLIEPFCATFGIQEEDFQKPEGGWPSFNDFFQRKLAPGRRPLPHDPCQLACPGEGRVRAFSQAPPLVSIKGQSHSLASFLGDERIANRFLQGPCLLARLCPSDYHRFHFPFQGTILSQRTLPGTLYSVHPWAAHHVPDSWWRNTRTITILQTPYGQCACVAIGATSVGSIAMTRRDGDVLTGEEWGLFALGGSALAIFFEKGSVSLDADLLANTAAGFETYCQVLSPIGHWCHCPHKGSAPQ